MILSVSGRDTSKNEYIYEIKVMTKDRRLFKDLADMLHAIQRIDMFKVVKKVRGKIV